MALLTREVVVVNAGSTSLKLSLVDGDEQSFPLAALGDAPPIAAVGHRIVHGGERFSEPVLIDDDVVNELMGLVELAPLHMKPAVKAIRSARAAFPDLPHVAVFDTAFHATLPDVASTYLLARRFDNHHIRRYGFHGLSVQWVAERVPVSRLVVCHLGGGSSVTAVRDGRSIDTTMGFTPLDGVPMATRAGSLDPGALIYLLRRGVPLDELDYALEHESGLTALAGTGDVAALTADHSPKAQLALDIYGYRIAQAIGAMAVALEGLDAIAFTAGVGEHSPHVRSAVCRPLHSLGVEIDVRRNETGDGDREIGTASARAKVHVIAAREDVMVARAVRLLAG